MLLRPCGVFAVSGSASSPGSCPWAVPVTSASVQAGGAAGRGRRLGPGRGGPQRPGRRSGQPADGAPSGPGAKAGLARAELARLAAGDGAIEVIVGLPTSLSGREGAAAAGARSSPRSWPGGSPRSRCGWSTSGSPPPRRTTRCAAAGRTPAPAASRRRRGRRRAAASRPGRRTRHRPSRRPARPGRRRSRRVSENGGGWPQSPPPPQQPAATPALARIPESPRPAESPYTTEAAGVSSASGRGRLAPDEYLRPLPPGTAGAPRAPGRRSPAGRAAGPGPPGDSPWRTDPAALPPRSPGVAPRPARAGQLRPGEFRRRTGPVRRATRHAVRRARRSYGEPGQYAAGRRRVRGRVRGRRQVRPRVRRRATPIRGRPGRPRPRRARRAATAAGGARPAAAGAGSAGSRRWPPWSSS